MKLILQTLTLKSISNSYMLIVLRTHLVLILFC